MRGTTKKNMQGHLSEKWFSSITPKDSGEVFKSILNLYKEYHDQLYFETNVMKHLF